MNLDPYNPQTQPPLTMNNHVMEVIIIQLPSLYRVLYLYYICAVYYHAHVPVMAQKGSTIPIKSFCMHY